MSIMLTASIVVENSAQVLSCKSTMLLNSPFNGITDTDKYIFLGFFQQKSEEKAPKINPAG